MAVLLNQQRAIGIVLLDDGATIYNDHPVIGIRDASGLEFSENRVVTGVQPIDDGSLIFNDQPVIGAVVIEDGRSLYNNQPVIPVDGIPDPAEWTPADLDTSLLGWFSADNSDLIAREDDAVSSWADTVGGYELSQAGETAHPLYSADGFGGSPGIYTDGVDDQLTLASVPFPVGDEPCEIWAIVDQQSAAGEAGSRTIFMYGGTSNFTARKLERVVSGSFNRVQAVVGTGAASQTIRNDDVDFLGPHVVRAIFDAEATSIQIDESEAASVAAAMDTGSARTRLAARTGNTADQFAKIGVRDIIVTGLLDAEQEAAMWAWAMPRRNSGP